MTKNDRTREPESLERVRFEDCDPFGHLNNARYLSYFVNARERHLEQFYGLDIHNLSRTEGLNWFTRRAQVEFLRPAEYGMDVLIRTRLIKYSQVSLLIEAVMMDKSGANHNAICWMDFAFVNLKTGRPTKHTADMMKLFEEIHYNNGIIENEDFLVRVKQIKNEGRQKR